jgi:hypothetical protein
MESELLLLDNFIILIMQLPEFVQMNLSNKFSLQKEYLFLFYSPYKRSNTHSQRNKLFKAYLYYDNNLLLFCQYD